MDLNFIELLKIIFLGIVEELQSGYLYQVQGICF